MRVQVVTRVQQFQSEHMKSPLRPADELIRLEVLREFDLLDTMPEQALDDLTALTAHICGAPIALITLIDEQRQWFKANVGLPVSETSRDVSFCGHTILQRELFVVPDAAEDERFADNPLVTGDLHLRFYAGAPLVSAEGQVLGTLCVIDREPRQLTPAQQEALWVLSRQVMAQLELRRQKRELASRERFLRAIVESEPECVMVLDPEGSLRMMNRAGVAMIEVDAFEQVVGERFSRWIVPAHREQFQSLTERVLSGRSGTLQFQIAGSNGTMRWLETHAAPLHDEAGKVTTLLGITRDITERRRTETALHESEERLRLTLDAARMGTFDWDTPRGTITWSREHEALWGYAPGEFGGTYAAFAERVHRDDLSGVDAEVARCISAREPFSHEFRVVWPDGSVHWIASRGEFAFDAVGRPLRMRGVAMETTERKRAEELMRINLERFQIIARATNDAVWDWNLGTNTVWWNEGYQALFGHAPEATDPSVESRTGMIHPDDVDRVVRGIREQIDRGAQAWSDEYRFRRRDGTHAEIYDRGYIIRDADGTAVRMIGAMQDITERKGAEVALRASEANYRTLVESAADSILVADAQARFMDVNKAASRMFGYTRDEMLTMSAADIVVGPELARIPSELALLNAGDVVRSEWQCRRKDGTQFSAEVGSTILPDGRILGVLRDITARRWAESRIRHLSRVQSVLSGINQTIVREKDGRVMLEAACRIAVDKGLFRMAWIGLLDAASGRLEIVAHAGASGDTLAVVRALLADERPGGACVITMHALQTGEHGVCNEIASDPRTESWRVAALDRQYRAMASLPLKVGERVIGTFNAYSDESGFFDADEIRLLDELALDIAFALDVHDREAERRRIEHALRESEDRFRQVAENIDEVFWMTQTDGNRMLYVSPAYDRIWGRERTRLYESTRDWLDAVHPDDRAQVLHAVETKQARGDYDEVYRILRPDGTVRWIHDRAFPVPDATGAIIRIVGTAEDITEARQLEEQFRQSQKMEAIGQLAGGVAHDFNNILAAIMMQADLATMEANLPETALALLDDIKAATERAANLTRQLLAFSSRQIMQPRELDLNEIVTSLTRMLQRILGEDVRMQLDLHPGELLTRADAGMLDQVLLNLAVNARDAMIDGGRLHIETSEKILSAEDAASIPHASAGRYVCLRVTDTGSGIPPEHRSRIFEPFFTTKEAGKGTGLGLATVFGIIRQHRGSLEVESEVGHGTTFQVLLPAISAESASRDHAAATPHPRGGTEAILLVEDEPAVRMLTRVVLERAGYTVCEARDGDEALRVWEEHRDAIRLLLTDIVMPGGMNGRELSVRLKARNPALRVVFTSGYSADIAGRELSPQDARNFIQKPSPPQRLLETVRRCLDD